MSGWRKMKTSVTKADILLGLKSLGIKPGDRVMVHSSLSSLGYVKDGADAVVDALLEAVGPEGTIMMPSFNHGREEIFDIKKSPSYSGLITETLRKRAGTSRSLHPTHPYIACGRDAARLVQGHENGLTFGRNSPLGKLALEGGYVLLLGVTHRSNTTRHIGETLAKAPCIGYRKRIYKMRAPDGTIIKGRSMLWRSAPCPITGDMLEENLRRKGALREGHIGESKLQLMLAENIVQMMLKLCLGEKDRPGYCQECKIKPKRK